MASVSHGEKGSYLGLEASERGWRHIKTFPIRGSLPSLPLFPNASNWGPGFFLLASKCFSLLAAVLVVNYGSGSIFIIIILLLLPQNAGAYIH
jgi:hypothetical protein